MKKFGLKSAAAAAFLLVAGSAGASEAATSTATLTIDNTTPAPLTYVTSSCVGTVYPAWPASIAAGMTSGAIVDTSSLTSNGCQVTYERSDTDASCRGVATRIESGPPPAPWDAPTVNNTPTGSITCTDTITSVLSDGDWAVTLTAQ